jgi:hypothetical protein
MFRPLEKLIHAYFAHIWPIATCENQKTQVLQYLTNYVRILDQADNRHPQPAGSYGVVNVKAAQ